MDTSGALATIVNQPFGKFLLVLIAIGLIGYVLWRIVQAVFDPDHGVDIIRNFQKGDKLGLSHGLTYEAIDLVCEGKNVGIYAGSDKLAVVQDVKLNQITADRFAAIDFVTIRGTTIPYLTA